MSRLPRRHGLALLAATAVACSYVDSVALGPDAQGGSSGTGGASGGGASGVAGSSSGKPAQSGCLVDDECASRVCRETICLAASPSDGVKNGDESDVDCGGTAAPRCGDGLRCGQGEDCRSLVCGEGVCLAPSPSDGVKNGDESDVDCGGTAAPRCAVQQACASHDDCASNGCSYEEKCTDFASCTAHEGGDTCGLGEVDEAFRAHESCCAEAALPSGQMLDKYMVTAGRMRAFVERVGGDVRGYIEANKPAWWDAEYAGVSLPSTLDEVQFELSAEGASAGCFIGDTPGATGARTYWLPEAANVSSGSGRQSYSQQVLDTKALNCVRRPMIAALCAFDGKRVSDVTVLLEAWGPGRYPWGEADWNAGLAVHNRSYFWPPDLPGSYDQSNQVAAPGRRPLGNGPHGHSDLAGLMFVHGALNHTLSQGSFEAHTISRAAVDFTMDRKYTAIGGRCTRTL